MPKGKPLFKDGQPVMFELDVEENEVGTFHGAIYIIDANGIFGDNTQCYYDIWVPANNCLFKHIPESIVKADNTEQAVKENTQP